jgi:hypothetical protein
MLRPLYTDGGSGRLESEILAILGSMGCTGGLIVVLYFLLRPDPWETE